MSKKEELDNNINAIWDILTLSKECYQFSFYLYKPETEKEVEYLSKSEYFKFIRHILWRNTIIELSKLFSDSSRRDKFNIYHFIRKLDFDGYFSSFKVDAKKVHGWKHRLEEVQPTINIILRLRDKVYGHTDANFCLKDFEKISFEDVKMLIDIVESIIQEVYETVFDTGVYLETPLSRFSKTNIIKILIKEQESHFENFKNQK